MRPLALLIAAGVAVCGAAFSQPAEDVDLRLWLDFGEVGDGAFPCRATDALCRIKGTPRTQDGAAVISQYNALSVESGAIDGITEGLTLSVWLAPSERPSSYQTLLYKGKRQGAAVQEIQFMLSLFDGKPEFKFKDESGRWDGIMRNADQFTIPGGKPVSLGEVPAVSPSRWSHVAATFDRGLVCLYLNGAKVLSAQTPTSALVAGDEPLRIGEAQAEGGARAYLFAGLVDDVRVYGRAMDGEQVRGLYEAERPGKPDGVIGIERPLPEGYDPGFETKLPIVAAYEQDLPEGRAGQEPVTAAVRPDHGVPTLYVNGEPVYGMAMMPEPYAADEQVTLSCRDFAAAGVDIYSEIFWTWMTPGKGCFGWWLGPGEYDFERVDARVRAILAANPRALIFPRIKLNPPNWWLREHPDEIVRDPEGKLGEQASLASELWADTYERMLRDVIRHMETSDYAGHIIGYHPAGGGSSEWFWWGDAGRIDYSPAAIARYRKWLTERYAGDLGRLRRAWGDETASLEADPPVPQARAAVGQGWLRDPVKSRPAIDYREFLSDMVSSNIIRSCRVVKEQTDGKKIAGVFYGYSMYCLQTDGFQGLQDVLASPYVDFLASPTAYDHRRGGEPGSFISAYNGSYRLHNKLYWDEVDTRTHLFPGHETYRTDTLEETLGVLQRAAGYSLTRGTNLWWFLLAGNATFHEAEVMDSIARLKAACDGALEVGREQVAEVAVFCSERSMHYAAGRPELHRALLRDTLDELACMGAPYDVYLLPDIADPKLPEYKLYVFLNAFEVSPELRERIGATLRRGGKTAVWVYAPGYITPEGFSPGGLTELTGIGIKPGDGALPGELTVTDPRHPVTSALPADRKLPLTLDPSFIVEDPEATVLGTSAGKATLAVREYPEWRSVYSLLPLDRRLLLGLCRYAGVHVYSATFDPFSAGATYCVIHTTTEGAKRMALPTPSDVMEITAGRELGRGIGVIEEQLPAGVTRVYRTLRQGQ